MAVWAALAGSVASWALNKYGTKSGQGDAAAAAADPFAAQRPQYQSQLAGLMQGTVDPTKLDPSYNFRLQQGLGATERQLAARGMAGSGLEQTALMDYGQGMASQEYANTFERLSSLAGVGAGSPGTRAQILADQFSRSQAGLGMIGNYLGQGLYGWATNRPRSAAGDPRSFGGGYYTGFGNEISYGTSGISADPVYASNPQSMSDIATVNPNTPLYRSGFEPAADY